MLHKPACQAVALLALLLSPISPTFAQCDGSCADQTQCADSGQCAVSDECASDCAAEAEDVCYSDCCNCLNCRDYLFGDLGGLRSGLADNGILIQLPYTQFFSGIPSGGVQQTSKYGGKLDYFVTFQGAKLGFNEGLMVQMHAETRYGEDINGPAGLLAFPNANMLYPFPNQTQTAVTQFMVMQALSEDFVLSIGKYNTLDLFNTLYPNTGRGIDGFMNVSLIAPTTFFRTTGLSVNGAGFMKLKDKQVQSSFVVYDTNSTSTTMAPDLFDNGAVVMGYHRIFTEFGGQAGSHAIMGNYSNRAYASTDPLAWSIIPGQGVVVPQETGSWALAYLATQTLWTDCCNPARNVGLFSTWSIADGNPNPYSWTGSLSLQATGLLCNRPADTCGVGWFYDGLSSNFKNLINALPNQQIQDVQGVEVYYNAALRKWFHLTGDVQVVENQNVGDDTALILGLRAKIDL